MLPVFLPAWDMYSSVRRLRSMDFEENAPCTAGEQPGITFPDFEETPCFWSAVCLGRVWPWLAALLGPALPM